MAQRGQGARYLHGPFLLSLLWVAVLLTPNVRVAGIPIRLDDLIAFSVGGWWLLHWVYGGGGRFPATAIALAVTAVYIALVTVMGAPTPDLYVGPKEWLDCLRPLKFLVILVISSSPTPRRQWRSLLTTVSWTVWIPLLLALAQFQLLNPESENLLAGLSLRYTDIPAAASRVLFGFRPFATFNTPTDLGYFATCVFLIALYCVDIPARRFTMAAGLVLVILSGARTFIYLLPFFLLSFVFAEIGIRKKIKSFLVAVGIGTAVVLLLIFAFPVFSEYVFDTASNLVHRRFSEDDSIRIRIENLQLASYTWKAAPWTGVISRDLFYRGDIGGVDSEYLMTFHRYGIFGLATTAVLYTAIAYDVWIRRRAQRQFANALLAITVGTFAYGLTQGALINSRVGCFLFILLGVYLGRSDAIRDRRIAKCAGAQRVARAAQSGFRSLSIERLQLGIEDLRP